MSLLVWLPLLGDLKNQGTTAATFTIVNNNSKLAINDSGKIGKCYERTVSATADTIRSSLTYNLNNDISMACWAYVSSTPGDSANGLITNHSHSDNTGVGITVKQVSTTDYRISCNTGTGSSRTYNTYYGTTNIKNAWHHLALTYSKSAKVLKLWVDGVVEYTLSNYTNSSKADYFDLFNWSTSYYTNGSYRPVCKLNDVRLYDHCLSTAEVKELAKGLICHYKLDNQYSLGALNKYSGEKADGSCTSSVYTKTKLSNERGYNYKLNRTGNGSDSWQSLNIGSAYSFTAGKKYYYSCKVRCNKWTAGTLSMRAARSTNDWVTNSVVVCSTALADGKWHEYTTYQTVNSTYDRSGSTVTSNPILEFYTSNQNGSGTVYNMDFDLKDLQVIESDVPLPFIKNEMTTTTITDSSGYGYNLSESGNFTLNNDSPRYGLSVNFNKSGYLINSNFTVPLTTFTLNIWVYPRTATSQHFLFGTFSSWPNNGIGIYRDANATKYLCLIRTDTASSYSNNSMAITLNTWNMITLTFSGTKYLGYVNGVKLFDVSYGSSGTIKNYNLMVGNSKYNSTPASENEEASISDIRLYSTCFSDADVLALYKTAGKVTNNGDIMAYEFKEVL